ncbi:pentatricopeptide repeat-containing protein At1g05670, mitochondrial-like [Vigna angularis]|uniref:pentatricopeptide repeat-containing protein At1g05670, mitochondrial-like n=1 Tax=Phaseolus angularis TaxID=3914 RepID=UPI0022B4EC3C|nr:pentatricopeptide repeat-containing protein At1g05670, mitochondrial-like [Vigna angularis]
MEFVGSFPDVVSYSVIINGYCQVEQIGKVLKLLEKLKGKGFVFTTLISGFDKSGNVSAECNLFDEMRHKKIVLDFVTYTSMINGLCEAGKVGEMKDAFSVHNQMVEKGLTPNVITCTTLVDGLCKHGEVGNIEQEIKIMEEMDLAWFYPDTITNQWSYKGFLSLGNIVVPSLSQAFRDCAWSPILVSLKEILDAYAEYFEFWENPDLDVSNSFAQFTERLIYGYKDWDSCDLFLARLSNSFDGKKVAIKVFREYPEAFCKKKKFVEAKKLFEMRTQGFDAEKEIYDIFVDANYEERKCENTLELIDEAIVKCLLKRT